jgi:uncharacterized protein (TIGR02246 family)
MAYPRIVEEWLAAWNAHDVEGVGAHFAADAEFVSPSVLAMGFDPHGVLRGRAAIAAQARAAFARYPKLRFEIETVLEYGNHVLVLYRKHGVFAENPGLTVEVFEVEGGHIRRSTVYWGVEEVAARFTPTR